MTCRWCVGRLGLMELVMKLFLLPTEGNNYFGSVSKNVSVVC